MSDSMQCSVWRSSEKDFTYVYLRDDLEFDDLPEGLRVNFGEPVHVMDLELTAGRQLAQAKAEDVMASLGRDGFHLQLPPTEDPSGWLELSPVRNLEI